MELASLPLLGFLASLIFLLLLKKVASSAPAGKRLPPGPWNLPLLGSLHHVLLSRDRDLPHRALRELSGRHGPLMLLRFGVVPTLVVSSAEAAREVLKTHDTSFASRHLSPTLNIFASGGKGVVFAPYGDLWRRLRRVCVLELFSTRRVQSFRHIREDETAGMLRSIANECARSGSVGAVVEIGELVAHVVTDIVVRSAIGSRCSRRDEFLRCIEETVQLIGGFNLADLFPSSTLAGWLSGGFRKADRCNQRVRHILDDIILEKRTSMATDHGSESEEDLLSVLLRVQKDDGVQCDLTTIILELFGAGTETSSTTLEWAMSELVRKPRLLHKAQAEVREAFKGQHKITEADMVGKLSYLHLVIRETLRLHAPVPFLLPRLCREQCQMMGYDIPEGAKVLVNVWAMGRDGAYWEDAEEFKPERFEASTAVDFKGGDFEFLPFGAGRRICPGMGLGLANMELLLASLLYHFDWELPTPEELDMSESFGITICKKSKLVLRATQRIPFAN
ncbi:unnamed protein product [Alopecurus aequalis]